MTWIQNFFHIVWIVKIEEKSFFKSSHLQISLFFANGTLLAVNREGLYRVTPASTRDLGFADSSGLQPHFLAYYVTHEELRVLMAFIFSTL